MFSNNMKLPYIAEILSKAENLGDDLWFIPYGAYVKYKSKLPNLFDCVYISPQGVKGVLFSTNKTVRGVANPWAEIISVDYSYTYEKSEIANVFWDGTPINYFDLRKSQNKPKSSNRLKRADGLKKVMFAELEKEGYFSNKDEDCY